MERKTKRLSFLLLCAAPLLFGTGCMEDGEGIETLAMTSETCQKADLTDGTAITDTTRPEVGRISGCTATLISPQWFITAAHCVGYGNPTGGTFTTGTNSYSISRIYSLSNSLGEFDVAVGRLTSQVPSTVATPAKLAEIAPSNGEQVTVLGFGCSVRPNGGTSTKRYKTFNWGTSDRLCPGDSGGPVRRGNLNAAGEIIAINSGYTYSDTNNNGSHDSGEPTLGDIYADATLVKPRIEAVMRAVDSQLEVGINRAGFDIANMSISNSSGNGPTLCKNECRKNKDCKSFTYVLSTQRCWLKKAIPDASPNTDTISGLPDAPGVFDRIGSDFSSYSVSRAEICESDCAANANCDAYTYASGNCWLKNAIPAVSTCSSCRSGNRRSFEPGVDRAGSDYGWFWTTSLDPWTCAHECARAAECRAWTYVPKGIQGTNAVCWLKNEVRDPSSNSSTGGGVIITSGVKLGMEANINRAGSDISNYFISTPEPQICQADCYKNSSCKAWTYVPPGVQGDKAKCWLKNAIPSATTSIGMVSGRKGMEFF